MLICEFIGSVRSKLLVYNNRIVVYPEKLWFESQKELEVPLSKISGIVVKKPGVLIKDGYIQIQASGLEKCANMVSFTGMKKYEEAITVKEQVMNLISINGASDII